MTEQSEGNACPFCGGTIKIFPIAYRFMVHCQVCNTYGPEADTPREAISLWNTFAKNRPDLIVKDKAKGK